MHALEFMLFVLSHRIKSGEFSANQLADECIGLASASHSYAPTPNYDGSDPDAALAKTKWNRDYHKWFDANRSHIGKVSALGDDRDKGAKAHRKTKQRAHHIDKLARNGSP